MYQQLLTFCVINTHYQYAFAYAHLTNSLLPCRLLFQLQLQRLLGSDAKQITSYLPTSPGLNLLPLYLVDDYDKMMMIIIATIKGIFT